MKTNPLSVNKEKISSFTFPKGDVLSGSEHIQKRRDDLEMATRLGNNYRRKVKIVFEDAEGVKQVETTIWAAMEKNIALKGGTNIPIRRIHEVKIF